jgi:hypothetical protein
VRPLRLVFADQDARIGQVVVRRHFQVVRGRLALVDAAGQVEGRAVAGAEEAARPVGIDAGPAPVLNLSVGEQPRCVQMPTTTRYSGLIERASFLAYSGCIGRLDVRVGSPVIYFSSDSSISLVRLNDPHRLAAPFDAHHLAGGQLADIGFDRRAGRLGAL